MNHRRGAMHVRDSWAEARTEAITLSKIKQKKETEKSVNLKTMAQQK